jgi:hypothetical protein
MLSGIYTVPNAPAGVSNFYESLPVIGQYATLMKGSLPTRPGGILSDRALPITAQMVNENRRSRLRPAGSGLRIISIQQLGSFGVNAEGVGDAIEAMGQLIDPLSRKMRKEQLRHDAVMNRLEEQQEIIETQTAAIEALIRVNERMVEAGAMTREESGQRIRDFIDARGGVSTLLAGELQVRPALEQ